MAQQFSSAIIDTDFNIVAVTEFGFLKVEHPERHHHSITYREY